MIIAFELQGSRTLHKGIFDTNGLWVRFEEERDYVPEDVSEIGGGGAGPLPVKEIIVGYKIYSHFSFSFYHERKEIVEKVYLGLMKVLSGSAGSADIDGVGFIHRLNK